eukprot:6372614-Pyramimonas_sp.AAC.1
MMHVLVAQEMHLARGRRGIVICREVNDDTFSNMGIHYHGTAPPAARPKKAAALAGDGREK